MRRNTLLLLLVSASLCAAQNGQSNNTRDAVIRARMRFLGSQVLPFTSQKQNAAISGISNTLQDGVLASDIVMSVIGTYDNIGAYQNNSRKLLQSYPAVDVLLNITTSASKARQEETNLYDASNKTYALASSIGSQGLQTQQIVVQSLQIQNRSSTPPSVAPPPESPSPPPSSSPPPPDSPPPQSSNTPPPPPTEIPTATPSAGAPSPAVSGTASGNAASSQSSGGKSLSTGAIIGIAVGAAVGVILVVAGVLLAVQRSRAKNAEKDQVIGYFHGVSKPGPSQVEGITANSSSAMSQPANGYAPTAPPMPSNTVQHDSQAGQVIGNGEKVELPHAGEKVEVPQRKGFFK